VFFQLQESKVPPICHSERSEESNWTLLIEPGWILRFAQNDKPVGRYGRGLAPDWVLDGIEDVLTRHGFCIK
jgi:hypothetical protein